MTIKRQIDRRRARHVAVICAISALILIPAMAFGAMGYRINRTASHVPAGIYRATTQGGDMEVGDIITFDVDDIYEIYPERRDEQNIYNKKLMKIVAALGGSVVERSGDMMIIDGTNYPHTAFAPLRLDGSDPCKISYPHIVAADHVWVMNDSRNAYDSRYFGDIPISVIRERVKPVFLW